MNVFMALVKNDLNYFKDNKKYSHISKKWYQMIIWFLVFIVVTVLILTKNITPYMINIIPAIALFSAFPIGIKILKREWSGNTISWWLQLPYSRKFLLTAKFTAAMIRLLRMILITVIVSIFIWVEGSLLQPHEWQQYHIHTEMYQMFKVYLQVICISPLFIAYGLFLVMVRNTSFSFIMPVLWVAFGALMSVLYSTFFSTVFTTDQGIKWQFVIPGFNSGFTYFIGVIIVLILAFIMMVISKLILEKQIEI